MTIEKIIVLGSDLNLRNALEGYLRRCRYDVASASTIAAAREYLSKDNFDIIFMDLVLPDGGGPSFLKEILARPSKPLVVITGGANAVEPAVDCIKDGAFDYLIRPAATFSRSRGRRTLPSPIRWARGQRLDECRYL